MLTFSRLHVLVHGSIMFSKIDLSNAFLQVSLSDASRELTTITTPFGLYRYCRLPFGLSVSPGIFQRAINSVLKDIKGALAYQDDILIFEKTIKDHDDALIKTLNRLNETNVKINAKKSVLQCEKIPYLGFVLSKNGITPDLNRIKSI